MTMVRRKIGEMLVSDELITEEQLAEGLARMQVQGGKLVENLCALGYLTPQDFVRFLAAQGGLARVELANYSIPRDITSLIPSDFARKHEVLPIDKMGSSLTLGMACPLDQETIDLIASMTNLRVRPVLVSIHEMRVALDRYYGALPSLPVEPEVGRATPVTGGAESNARVTELVRKIGALPALPETVAQLREAMMSADASPAGAARIIERDPALAAKVLGLANSAAFARAHKIDSVLFAVTLLGLREIYHLAMAAAVVDYFTASSYFDYRFFWKRSMLCAQIGGFVAEQVVPEERSAAVLAGLLHDLGKVALAQVIPDEYARVEQQQPDRALLAQERELVGITHPEIGFLLSETWGLPRAISVAIGLHGDACGAHEHARITTAVALASAITDTVVLCEKGFEEETLCEVHMLAEHLRLDASLLQELLLRAWEISRDM